VAHLPRDSRNELPDVMIG